MINHKNSIEFEELKANNHVITSNNNDNNNHLANT